MDTSPNPGEVDHSWNLSRWAVTHPAFVTFLILACSAAGMQAYFQMGRAEDPFFTTKAAIVSATWPGATSEEMQQQVAEEVEDKLRETPYLDFLQTYCLADRMLTIVQIKDTAPRKEFPNIWYQVRKKLGDIRNQMPQGVIGPDVNDEYGDVYSALYAFTGDEYSPAELKRICEKARKQLLRIGDVEKVDIIGEQAERIYIEFSHSKLSTLGVTPQQIFDSVQRQNVLMRSGSIDTRTDRIHVRVSRDFDGIKEIKAVPVQANGRVFRLSDIAEVKRGYEDPPLYLVRFNGKPAVALGVVMSKGGNVVKLGELLNQEFVAIREQIPLGVSIGNIAFQPHVVEESVGEFIKSFVEALIIVLVVSFLRLRLSNGYCRGIERPPGLIHLVGRHEHDGHEFGSHIIGSIDSRSWIISGRRDHCSRNDGRENGRRLGTGRCGYVRLDFDSFSNAVGDVDYGGWVFAGRICEICGWRIRRWYFLGSRYYFDCIVVRRGSVYSAHRRETLTRLSQEAG